MAKGVVAFVLGVGLTGVSCAQAATDVIFNVFTGPRHFVNAPFKTWAKDVERVTEGRVNIQFLPANAAPPPKQMDAAVGGQFDAAFIFHGFIAKRATGPQFGNLPFILEGTAEQGSVAYWRTYQTYFGDKNEFDKSQVQILSMWQFPGGNFYSGTSQPIISIADLRARKVWALAGTASRTLKAAGVNHVSGPAARVSEFTRTKVVEALAGISMNAVQAFGALNFTQSATVLPGKIQAASFAMFMVARKWSEISPGDQQRIMLVSGEKMARAMGRRADAAELAARNKFIDAGVKILAGSAAFKAELLQAGSTLVARWIAKAKSKLGVDGRAVIEAYRAEVKRLQAGK